jgi:hypothetical protein
MTRMRFRHAWGLAALACSTVMFELLLTRVFSVTMWYHFSFLAISVAMLGLTVGAVAVYSFPKFFSPDRLPARFQWFSFAYAFSIAVCYWLMEQLVGVFDDPSMTLLFLLLVTTPFVLGGLCVTLLFQHYADEIDTFYAFDLGGAAVASLAVVGLLSVTDPSTGIFAAACLAMVASGLCGLSWRPAVLGLLVLSLATGLSARAGGISFAAVKGQAEKDYLYTGWNTFSRVTLEASGRNPLWLSAHRGKPIESMALTIDAVAGTDVLKCSGDFTELDYLGTDITSAVYHLVPEAKVLVLGCGGGRDVATALHFKNPDVTTAEMNDLIVGLLKGPLARYSGGLAHKVRMVNDEARSFLARQSDQRYDIIQMSLIDTTAAVASGAYLLSEHSLYTVEAWTTILSHLTDRGMFSVTRNRYDGYPLEVYRCVTLAVAALRNLGVSDPRRHILVYEYIGPASPDPNWPRGMTTLLISRQPISAEAMARSEQVARHLTFPVRCWDNGKLEKPIRELLDPASYEQAIARAPVDITPPEDDRPFFFFHLRPDEILNGLGSHNYGALFYFTAVRVLFQLVCIVGVLTTVFVILPLALRRQRPPLDCAIYFGTIGFAYMTVEIAMLQILNIFLGHPIYSLTVILAGLLLSSALGGPVLRKLQGANPPRLHVWPLLITLAVGWLTWTAYPWLLRDQGFSTPARICLAWLTLGPLGVAMGMPFPLVFRWLARTQPEFGPWYWGVNGAASVMASILSIIVALLCGLKVVFGLGLGAYGLAALSLHSIARRTAP